MPPAPLVEPFDHAAPRRVPAIGDLAQIQNRTLHHTTAFTALAFDNAPVTVLLTVLPSPCESQVHGKRFCAETKSRKEGRSSLPGIIGTMNEPLRPPTAPGLSLTGFRLVIPDHALGFPVLRTLSLCTCCRHYPGTAAGRIALLIHPTVSAFPERVVGSACALSFSRLARRLLALRPAHSRCHRIS